MDMDMVVLTKIKCQKKAKFILPKFCVSPERNKHRGFLVKFHKIW
jgi:hypothetical protein